MVDDVVLNKAAVIERCIARVREEYAGDPRRLRNDITRQDSIILDLQRACEAAIDLAMHVVRIRRLGVPQETRESFAMMRAAGLLDETLTDRMMRRVGFRNVAVHDYCKRDLDVVERIVTDHLDELLGLASALVRSSSAPRTPARSLDSVRITRKIGRVVPQAAPLRGSRLRGGSRSPAISESRALRASS